MLMSHLLDTNSSSAWLLRELTAATSPFGTMEVEKKKRFNVKLGKSFWASSETIPPFEVLLYIPYNVVVSS